MAEPGAIGVWPGNCQFLTSAIVILLNSCPDPLNTQAAQKVRNLRIFLSHRLVTATRHGVAEGEDGSLQGEAGSFSDGGRSDPTVCPVYLGFWILDLS